MLRIGLTGGIGSGKSLVARILRILEVPVFEADAQAKDLMQDDGSLKRSISNRFGSEIYSGGALQKKVLAGIVFHDPKALQDLNAMVHPVVRRKFGEWAAEQSAPYVVMEAAILAETGGHEQFDGVIVVSAPEHIRTSRVMQRDGVGAEAVKARMRNQVGEEQRLAIADHVILNDDGHLVIPQVLEVHRRLCAG